MADRRRTGLADAAGIVRAAPKAAGDVVRSPVVHQHLLRWVATAGLYMMAVQALMVHVAALDHGRLAQRFPHLALCVALIGVYVTAVAFEHVAAAVLSVWDPMLIADYFAPHRLARRVRRVLVTIGVVLAFGTSQLGMWLLPMPDQEGPAVRMAAMAGFVFIVGTWLGRTIKRLRVARVGDQVRELAAALRAERELERERRGR
jgi:hypothetical protein